MTKITSKQIEDLKTLLRKENEKRKKLIFFKGNFRSELIEQILKEKNNDI